MPRKSGLKTKRIEAGHSSSQKANVQNLPITPRRKTRFGSKTGIEGMSALHPESRDWLNVPGR
jgi:hypothetical protein